MAIKETFPRVYEGSQEWPEARILRELSEVDCVKIIQLRAYGRFPNQDKHRLYLEYALYGNLNVLLDRHRRWRRYLPEPFLLYIFHHLATAVFIMQKGRLPDGAH